ncbi:putative Fe-S protein YdhL (DUF1289 family) [Duganella sp. 1224]|uniref:DUF3106 domain-containing protein n=1 Tax=Duganella sp. 1224 TaxID=2587052 RepID=UPI0015CC590E|nr:DUF3106 domain-containing protein [Duganella sp. 1224]NYE59131.1 putative Fe-S protein YdhL (DUF1289 family) [Duganella sp. 1224]
MAWSGGAKLGAGVAVAVVALGGAAWLGSQPDAPALVKAPVAAVTGAKLAGKAPEKVLWKDLSPAQRQALEPLAAEWDGIEPIRKQKWLAIARRYEHMKADEQARVHERMREWVLLSPEERRQVRQNYARAQKLNPSQKAVSWEEYQMLSDEQKKELAARVPQRKQVVNLPTPAQAKVATPAPIKPATPAVITPIVPPASVAPADPSVPLPNASNVTPVPPTATPATQGTPADVK